MICSHLSLPVSTITHVHQQSQGDVIPHSTLLSCSGCQVGEPSQRHPVLVEIRVQRLVKLLLVRCHKSCRNTRQMSGLPLAYEPEISLSGSTKEERLFIGYEAAESITFLNEFRKVFFQNVLFLNAVQKCGNPVFVLTCVLYKIIGRLQ